MDKNVQYRHVTVGVGREVGRRCSTKRVMNRPFHSIGDVIEMGIEDEGPGIPKDLRERVFDKFSGPLSGTGMGLAIAKGIVEAHEGRIWIESGNGGKGTRVLFTVGAR